MDPQSDCHTLETKAMSAEECHRLKEEIESAIARQENFVDKCKILWDRMKTLMTGIAQLKTRKCLKDKEQLKLQKVFVGLNRFFLGLSEQVRKTRKERLLKQRL